ncbi:NACHT domain-containing protein [Promicromonospora sp. NPDC057138]|uniref:NACHT domain-containing protein n=1 Tax=Promicromonospora sp. NPDC057138 TaxID=3346031 RepID=UPI0036287CE4
MSTPSNGRQRAVDSLVAIAIAALDQAMPLSGTVGAAVLQNALRSVPQRTVITALDDNVMKQVRTWATREGLHDDLEAGLQLAKQALRDHGATPTTIAEANYVADQIASSVIQAARTGLAWDRQIQRWGRDDAYNIAERAIRVVYDNLIAELRASEPAVTGLASLGARLDKAIALIHRLQVAGGPTRVQLIAYLTARLADWDRPVWGLQAPITIRRRVHLRPPATGGASSGEAEEVSEADALEKHDMLVVLAGPGSGKTWLARWYAREAARRALDRLGADAQLEDVEIPLFVTWDQWSHAGGGVRDSLVDASFAAGSGHSTTPGDATVMQFLLNPATRVLLIVDSLDEAADHQGQVNRLHELSSLVPAWRVVVTSRPAAWERTASTFPDRRGLGITDLQDLSYPADVDAFVGSWFESDQDKATMLLEQIRTRPELARPAGSPLMLTIYCLLIQHDTKAGLPTRRHRLYDALARQLMKRWDKNRGINEPLRYDERLQMLGRWAWHAVGSSNDPYTGLGNWADTLTTPDEPTPIDVAPLDEIAPKISSGGPVGRPVRRFVHRTLLEHFVAEHISTLDADRALRILLPHLWFDPDWQAAAPAAVAAHNRVHPGELFERILTAVTVPSTGNGVGNVRAGLALDDFLLAVAEDSDPCEWQAGHQAVLHACRIRNATVSPDKMARTAHWQGSNMEVIEQVVDRMAARTRDMRDASPDWDRYVQFDGRDLAGLAQTDTDRAMLRVMIMDRLDSAADRGKLELVIGLVSLGLIWDLDRPVLLDVLTRNRNKGYDPYGNDLAIFIDQAPDGLNLLARTEDERSRIADRLREDLGGVDYGLYIVHGMRLLERPEDELEHVRGEFISAIRSWGGMGRDLAEAVFQIGLSTAQRDLVAEALLGKMAQTNDHVTEHAAWEARSLARINPTARQKEQARSILLRLLPENTRAWKVRQIVKALVALDATDSDKRSAIDCILLAMGDQYDVDDEMFDAFTRLDPTASDVEQARRQVLRLLEVADSSYTDDAARWLASLDPSDAERLHVRAVLLQRLSENLTSNISALLPLRPTDGELNQARETVLRSMRLPNARTVTSAASALSRLKPTSHDREAAREHLQAVEASYAASRGRWFDVRLQDYVDALLQLGPTPEERARARNLILGGLSNPNDTVRLTRLRQTSTPQTWLHWVNGA